MIAEDFLLITGKLSAQTLRDRKLAEERVTVVLNALEKLGFNLDFDENKISQLADLGGDLTTEFCENDEECIRVQDDIWNMDDLNLLTKQIACELTATLLMSDEQFVRQQETRKKLNDLLLSLVKKQNFQ